MHLRLREAFADLLNLCTSESFRKLLQFGWLASSPVAITTLAACTGFTPIRAPRQVARRDVLKGSTLAVTQVETAIELTNRVCDSVFHRSVKTATDSAIGSPLAPAISQDVVNRRSKSGKRRNCPLLCRYRLRTADPLGNGVAANWSSLR